MSVETLILIRHGETLHNVAGIAQGWQDSELSERGQRQVRQLAERLKAMRIDAIFSSPLSRALATAQAVADATGLAISTIDELREMNYGGWEGRSFLDVRKVDEDIFQKWIADGATPCPDGESHSDVRARMEAAFAKIGGDGAKRVAVVTHGTAIRVAVTALLELPVMTSRHFAQDNAAMNVFVRRADRWILKVWNDATHCVEPK